MQTMIFLDENHLRSLFYYSIDRRMRRNLITGFAIQDPSVGHVMEDVVEEVDGEKTDEKEE